MSEGEDREYLSVKEAAAILGFHPKTVAHYCRDGLLRARRMSPNGRWRIPRESVQNLDDSLAIPELA